jgi:hypothetical protein
VLADHLTRQEIAVLRVDDRGVGGYARIEETFSPTALEAISDWLRTHLSLR